MSDSATTYCHITNRLLPGSQGKAKKLTGLAGACRFVWNGMLAQQNEACEKAKAAGDNPFIVRFFSQCKRLAALRRKIKWLPEHLFRATRYTLRYQTVLLKDGKGRPKLHSQHGRNLSSQSRMLSRRGAFGFLIPVLRERICEVRPDVVIQAI